MGRLTLAVLVRPQRLPLRVGHQIRQPQARKDDHPAWHSRDPGDERRDCRRRRRDSGRDGEPGRRVAPPPLGDAPKDTIAPLGQVDRAAVREDTGPAVDDLLQPFERTLPVLGNIVGTIDRIPQAPGIDLLDFHRIERRRQVGCETDGLGGTIESAANDRRQCQRSFERVDRRRDRLAVGRLERAADAVVELGIAERDQARQQQAGTALAHKSLGERAHRAIVGKQDPPAGKAQRVTPEALDQPGGERIGERAVRRDGEDRRVLRQPIRHPPAPLPFP